MTIQKKKKKINTDHHPGLWAKENLYEPGYSGSKKQLKNDSNYKNYGSQQVQYYVDI